tara:strand:+ start:566 stop:853 length:288 start_codon:yes stop_codon:yes gene_type:complete
MSNFEVMDDDGHGMWFVQNIISCINYEEDKYWLRCGACAMKTKSHWYRTYTDCNCPGNADIDDCKCEEVELECIFCGYCGEYNKGVSYIRNGRFI